NWEMLDQNSDWTLFEYVRETMNPLHNAPERATFFPRDIDLGNKSISVWNHDWKSTRTGANHMISYHIDTTKNDSVSYIMKLDAPGVKEIEQKITFSIHHGRITLEASLDKEDVRTPESIYFAFPL